MITALPEGAGRLTSGLGFPFKTCVFVRNRTGGRKSESATRYPLSRFDHEYEGGQSRSLQTEFQASRAIIKRVREENALFDVKPPKMHGFF